MCDLNCAVISCCVRICVAGKINVCDKIVIENEKNERKYGINNFYINLHLKDGFGTVVLEWNSITACKSDLMPARWSGLGMPLRQCDND